MATYIVCWMAILEKPDKEGNIHKDHYQTYMDKTDDENLIDATEHYNLLVNNKNIYSANICKVVKSTDYD